MWVSRWCHLGILKSQQIEFKTNNARSPHERLHTCDPFDQWQAHCKQNEKDNFMAHDGIEPRPNPEAIKPNRTESRRTTTLHRLKKNKPVRAVYCFLLQGPRARARAVYLYRLTIVLTSKGVQLQAQKFATATQRNAHVHAMKKAGTPRQSSRPRHHATRHHAKCSTNKFTACELGIDLAPTINAHLDSQGPLVHPRTATNVAGAKARDRNTMVCANRLHTNCSMSLVGHGPPCASARNRDTPHDRKSSRPRHHTRSLHPAQERTTQKLEYLHLITLMNNAFIIVGLHDDRRPRMGE